MKIDDDSEVRVYQRKSPPIDTWDRKDLKVISYKNYGWTMSSGDKDEEKTKFLWSFYQLNNFKVISLQFIEYPLKDNLTPDLHFHISNSYLFKDNFWEYWEKLNKKNDQFYKKLKEIKDEKERSLILEMEMSYNKPFENEEKCVKDFFYLNIIDKRYDKTDKVVVK